jgi:hypothetical protein
MPVAEKKPSGATEEGFTGDVLEASMGTEGS